MKCARVCVAAVALGVLGEAGAQEMFDFDAIPGVAQEPNVQVDLGPALLRFAAEAARQSDPGAAEMIAGLDGISVRVYEDLQDASAVSAFVDQASGALEQEGWERIVYVQDGVEKVRIYARMEAQEMAGMTVLVLDSSEAVFISIDGRINPTQLGRVAGAMGFGGMLGAFSGAPAGSGRDD